MIRDVLLLGDPRLARASRRVWEDEAWSLQVPGDDLRDTLLAFRRTHGAGRGTAAPQVGERIRAIYLGGRRRG